jgi:hypothetical protein
MEYFEDYGKGLYLGSQTFEIYNRQPRDFSRLHIHPHYEMLTALDAQQTSTIINGHHIKTEYPFIAIVAPYNMHFTYYYGTTD